MSNEFEDKPAVDVFEETRRYVGFPSYTVSESGAVRRIGVPGSLKPQVMKRGGYLAVNLQRDGKGHMKTIHRLVCMAFHGPPPTPKHDAAHNDGNKLNNHWTNLRWATRRENEADKVRHGTSNRGQRNGMAKLSDAQRGEILAMLASGVRQAVAAEMFGITQSGIARIKARATK